MNIIEWIILISWFISGLCVAVSLWIDDMRYADYDEKYFNIEKYFLISDNY